MDEKDQKEEIIPLNVETIGEYSFYEMPKLKMIVLPSSLTRIKTNGITKCPELEYVYHYSKTTPSVIDETVLNECPKVTKIYGGIGYEDTYIHIIGFCCRPERLQGLYRRV